MWFTSNERTINIKPSRPRRTIINTPLPITLAIYLIIILVLLGLTAAAIRHILEGHIRGAHIWGAHAAPAPMCVKAGDL